tara:strand:- start:158 stop:388 length:231 start_codon:yes stop_codon:yes gene_type:complete
MGNNIKENLKKWADEQADIVENKILEKIDNPEVKAKVIKKWNDNINIPFLNERTEERIFTAIYDVVVDVIKQVMNK